MGSSTKMEFGLRFSPRELPELMDGDCSYEDFRGCLRSMEQIDRWLLGYRPTMAWLKRLPRGLRDPVHIVDMGSGGGNRGHHTKRKNRTLMLITQACCLRRAVRNRFLQCKLLGV